MLAFTTSAPETSFFPDGRNGGMERILWPVHAGVLALTGYDVLRPFSAHGIPFVGEEAMQNSLKQFEQRLTQIEDESPLFFHKLEDFGDDYRLKTDIEPATPMQHRGRRLHLR